MKTQKTRFWLILAIINIAAMIYPVNLYAQADNSETQIFSVITLFCTAFLLAITDAVSALVVYME